MIYNVGSNVEYFMEKDHSEITFATFENRWTEDDM